MCYLTGATSREPGELLTTVTSPSHGRAGTRMTGELLMSRHLTTGMGDHFDSKRLCGSSSPFQPTYPVLLLSAPNHVLLHCDDPVRSDV